MKAKQAGNGRLEEALATLIQNQAQFVGQLSRTDERFARIETKLTQIEQILLHHQRTLDALPEAIREKIGFQGRQ
ncbi:MAG: hypothetical protein HYX72_15005 [Acidobacteria bacterium]|nr:hypothetical protein [Acidobacteriota bacterium]